MTSVFDRGHLYTNLEWLKYSQITVLRPWWPQRCCVTNQWLWIKPAVRVRRVLTGPDTPIVIDNWVESREYTIQALKGWPDK